MSNRERLVFAAIFFCGLTQAAAQDSQREFWPEFKIYVNRGERVRLIFQDSLNQDKDTRSTEGSFAYYFDLALRPLFRRELRHRQDTFRRRFLTFRAGYRYTTSFVNADPSSEKRVILESTARYPLPAKLVIMDRSRGEFRFIRGQSFSTRYRNRLWVERDLQLGALAFTPYVYDEVFYDTRYDAWTRNRFAFGLQFPAGPHVVIEPYVLRQHDSRSVPSVVEALGLKLSLYF
jgi:hypothetical protein